MTRVELLEELVGLEREISLISGRACTLSLGLGGTRKG